MLRRASVPNRPSSLIPPKTYLGTLFLTNQEVVSVPGRAVPVPVRIIEVQSISTRHASRADCGGGRHQLRKSRNPHVIHLSRPRSMELLGALLALDLAQIHIESTFYVLRSVDNVLGANYREFVNTLGDSQTEAMASLGGVSYTSRTSVWVQFYLVLPRPSCPPHVCMSRLGVNPSVWANMRCAFPQNHTTLK